MRRIDAKSALLGFGLGSAAAAIACVLYVTFASALGLVGEARILSAVEEIESRNEAQADSMPPLADSNVVQIRQTPTPFPVPVATSASAPGAGQSPEATSAPGFGSAPTAMPTPDPEPTLEPSSAPEVPTEEVPSTAPEAPTEEVPSTTPEEPTPEPPLPSTPQRGAVVVRIRRGDTAAAVTNRLKDAGVIDNAAAFLGRLAERRLTGELSIGEYELEPGMDIDAIIDGITVHK